MPVPRWIINLLAGATLAGSGAGCGRSAMPDPRDAAARYARAVERGDAAAVHALLTSGARQRYGEAETARLLRDARAELVARAKAVADASAVVNASAELRFTDGEAVHLALEDGEFRVDAAGTLPAAARTPAEALEQLRRALARRSYAALVRVLSADTQSALEGELRSLVKGLHDPETLNIRVDGERAEVEVPGGHVVRLRREAGVWRVEDFD
jgi:hypothetical protein